MQEDQSMVGECAAETMAGHDDGGVGVLGFEAKGGVQDLLRDSLEGVVEAPGIRERGYLWTWQPLLQ